MELLYTLSGLLVGFLVGLTGIGGGALMTPLLIFGFGLTPAIAVGTDLLYAALTKAGGIWTHHLQGSVDWKVASTLALGSVPAALLMMLVLHHYEDSLHKLDGLIATTLGVALILTSVVVLLRKRIHSWRQHRELSNSQRTTLTILTGVVLGSLVTLTSVGAGALGAAALYLLYPRLSSVRVVGTDLAHAVPLTMVAGIGHASLGTVDFSLLGFLLLGSLPGIYLGSRMSARVPEDILRAGLASILLVVGIRFII